SPDPLERILVGARHSALDEDAMPDCQLHEPPDCPARVTAHLLLPHERRHTLRDEPAADHRMARETCAQLVEEAAAEPLADRHVEASLPPPQVLGRQAALRPPLQEQLALTRTDLERGGQRRA